MERRTLTNGSPSHLPHTSAVISGRVPSLTHTTALPNRALEHLFDEVYRRRGQLLQKLAGYSWSLAWWNPDEQSCLAH